MPMLLPSENSKTKQKPLNPKQKAKTTQQPTLSFYVLKT